MITEDEDDSRVEYVRDLLESALQKASDVESMIDAHDSCRAVSKSAERSLEASHVLRDEALSCFVTLTNRLKPRFLRPYRTTESEVQYALIPHVCTCGYEHDVDGIIFNTKSRHDSTEDDNSSVIESYITGHELCVICYGPIFGQNPQENYADSDPHLDSPCCKQHLHSRCLAKWFRESISDNRCPFCRSPWAEDSLSAFTTRQLNAMRNKLELASIARQLRQLLNPLRQRSILEYITGGRKPLRQTSLLPYLQSKPATNLPLLRIQLQRLLDQQATIEEAAWLLRHVKQAQKCRGMSMRQQERLHAMRGARPIAMRTLKQSQITKYFGRKQQSPRQSLHQRRITSFLRV